MELNRAGLFFFILALSSCGRSDSIRTSVQLSPAWTLSANFDAPESVVYDSTRQVLYVSNVHGYEKNGLGYLSRIGMDGSLIERTWMQGLNGPTGMAIWRDELYVADVDELVRINLASRTIIGRYPASDSMPGLNDVTIDPKGQVFVSGSFSRTIYRLADEHLEPWVVDDQLKDANGLFATSAQLLSAGYYLRTIALSDGQIETPGEKTFPEDLESIESDGRGGFFLTTIGPRPIWHISSSGVPSPIYYRDVFSADVEFVQDENLLIVPSGGDELVAFHVIFGR